MYLEEQDAFAENLARSIKLPLMLVNGGNALAEDIDVFIHFDGDFEVVSEDGLKKSPAGPKKPAAPTPKQFGLSGFPDLSYRSFTSPSVHLGPSNVSGFRIRKTNSEEVRCSVGRIKQQTQIELGDVYVIFPSIAEAKSFNIEYTLNSASLPSNVEDKLHIKIHQN
jgi:hypothetical protein